jgi:frataxin
VVGNGKLNIVYVLIPSFFLHFEVEGELDIGKKVANTQSGVLNLSLPPHGHYVVNKQPPNQQIWISSPISGPSRFGYSGQTSGGGTWVHHRREGVTLGALLDKEIKDILEGSSIDGKWEGTGLK